MNNNPIRKEKIELLKSLLNGKPLSELLPKVEVFLIEHEPGEYFVEVDNQIRNGISVSETGRFIEHLKAENKGKIVKVSVITNAEYEALSEKIEMEY